jgi:hypothetical protein
MPRGGRPPPRCRHADRRQWRRGSRGSARVTRIDPGVSVGISIQRLAVPGRRPTWLAFITATAGVGVLLVTSNCARAGVRALTLTKVMGELGSASVRS